MKSARLVEPRRWELLDLPIPEPAPGTMLVHLQRTAICGTDKPAWMGLGGTYPMEPGRSGHEGLGTVMACPSGRYAEGERVLLYGFDRGLFQEYTLARDDGGCIRLPADGDPDVLLMSQLFGTVLHAFYKLGNIIGQDVVVIGQGPVGQLFNAALRNLGARHIIGVDPLAHRRGLAPKDTGVLEYPPAVSCPIWWWKRWGSKRPSTRRLTWCVGGARSSTSACPTRRKDAASCR